MHHRPLENGVPLAGDFELPAERRSRVQLANYLADLVSKDGNKLVEVHASPQARNEEREALAQFRGMNQIETPAVQTPGHLFKSADRNEFRLLLTLLMGFDNGWSFYVYSAPSHTTLLVNKRLAIWSPKKGIRNELGRHLATPRAA